MKAHCEACDDSLSSIRFDRITINQSADIVRAIHWQVYIEERKDVMVGKPVFRGTRSTVEFILRQLGAGMSHQDLLREYPTLKPEHLQAAMQYAAAVLMMDQAIYQ